MKSADEKKNDVETDEEYVSSVGALISTAIDYMDEEVGPDQTTATEYYRGEPLGNEEEGRSQIVMTEVRDTVQAMMPALLRIFTGPERAVEFIPSSESTVEMAEQTTDAVNHIFMSENHGFNVLYNGFKDALIRKTGILTWWVEEKEKQERIEYTDLTGDELELLLAEDGIEAEDLTEQEVPAPVMAEGAQPEPLYSLTVLRKSKRKVIRAATIPPEEFFISPDAHGEDDAMAIGRRRDITVSELVSMGFDEDEIRENAASAGSADFNELKQARVPSSGITPASDSKSADTVTYFDAYVLMDKDGDGIAERRRIRGINPKAPYILSIDDKECDDLWTDEVPFGILCPDPEPHAAIGYSIADQVADLQEIKTSVMRNTLDSLANSIHPRTGIVEGQVNIDDAMNTEVGAIIRMRQPGMVQELSKPFVGQYALPLIAYLDQVRGNRTGQTDASAGLDADVLQSTTQSAVTNTVSKAQERIEMIARIFAETGLSRMMKGLLRLTVQHSDKARMFRINKKWVSVDPRVWDADMDVHVNIGLGRGTDQDRLALYANIATKQETIIQQAGPTNPICGIAQLRNTYAKILEIGGERDVSRFFKQVDEAALAEQAAQAEPPPDPNMLLVQIEQQKAEVQAQKIQAELALEQQRHADEMAFKREELAQKRYLEMAKIEAQYSINVRESEINAALQREREEGKLAHDKEMRLTDLAMGQMTSQETTEAQPGA